MNFKELRQQYIQNISSIYENGEALAMFYITLEHLFKWNKSKVIMHLNDDVDADNEAAMINILAELNTGKPLQYILAETIFYNLPFKVTPDVLIPRPETEELVDWIIGDLKMTSNLTAPNILDIGTGSGCIAISIKKNLHNSTVTAIDVSSDALAIASFNATLNNVKVDFIEADILTYRNQVKYDLIVSNPPYVKNDEKEDMQENVLKFEPHTALFVEDANPLLFYQAIATFAQTNLVNKGLLFFEINELFGQETIDMLKDKGFTNIELRKDLQGKDRMIKCNLLIKTSGEIE